MTTDALRDYWFKRPSNVARYIGVVFYHPDAGYKRLLKNVPYDVNLLVDGSPQTFNGTSMDIPDDIKLDVDETDKGTITFERIGADVRQYLDAITVSGSLTNITARILTWLNESDAPVNDFTLDVGAIVMNERRVDIKLTLGNDIKIGRADEVYTSDEYVGLKYV